MKINPLMPDGLCVFYLHLSTGQCLMEGVSGLLAHLSKAQGELL